MSFTFAVGFRKSTFGIFLCFSVFVAISLFVVKTYFSDGLLSFNFCFFRAVKILDAFCS